MTSVFPSFSFSRRDAQSLMAATHRSIVFLANRSRCKQLLVVGEDVVKNVVVCIEDDDDIFRVRDKLDRPEHRALWNTARARNGYRLFAVD